jgi:hypothetical protein
MSSLFGYVCVSFFSTSTFSQNCARYTYKMPQSGKVYDTTLEESVQLYFYINASYLLLSESSTVCIFLYGDVAGTDEDNFDDCESEQRWENVFG